MSVITKIGTAVPSNSYLQEDLKTFMSGLSGLDQNQKRKIKALYAQSAIEKRHSVLDDFKHLEDRFFLPLSNKDTPRSVEQRMALYHESAASLSISAIEKTCIDEFQRQDFSHIITVSCTGMSAPGIEIELIERLKLGKNIRRSCINFMGCYAALHGLQQADDICKNNPSAVVLLVCVELCTLHFQSIPSDDNLLANSLFSDGAAACIVVSDKVAAQKKLDGLYIDKFDTLLVPNTLQEMAWSISSTGFLMKLNSYIPQLLSEQVLDFIGKSIQEIDIKDFSSRKWAIHPGGRKILDSLKKVLDLEQSQIQASYEILKKYGNMSSPTILFVLNHIMEAEKLERNRSKIIALAFGPGLVMESSTLTYV